MKNRARLFCSLTLILALVAACNKKEERLVYYYSNVPVSQKQYYLYVDDKFKGVLPHSSVELNISSDSLNVKTIPIALALGKHHILFRDSHGEVLIQNSLTLKKRSIKSSSKGSIPIKVDSEGKTLFFRVN